MKPVIFSIIGVLFVTLAYWLFGFDFDKRGVVLWSWGMYAALVGWLGWSFA